MRRFPMTLPRGVRLVTGLTVLFLAGFPLLLWGALPGLSLGPATGPARRAALLLPVIGLVAWALAPRALEVGRGELRVVRRAWRAISFPLQFVESVAVLPPKALRGAMRTFGVAGFFGFYGRYHQRPQGAFRLWATRGDRLVELRVRGRRIVVSPDDPERFVEAVLAAAPRTVGVQPGEPGAASASACS
jgi:Bacterial PH domain